LTSLSDEFHEYYNKYAKDIAEYEEVELQCERNEFTYDRARKQYIGFSRQGLDGKFLRKPMTEHYIKDVLECVKGSKHKPGYDGKAYLKRVRKSKRPQPIHPGHPGNQGNRMMLHTPSPPFTVKESMEGKEIFTPQLGEFLCAFASLCSAFWFFNDMKAYQTIFANMEKSLEEDPFILAASLTLTKELRYHPKMYRAGQLDILKDRSPFVTLAQLRAKDGCSMHCVATVGNGLFDANAQTVMELSQENLKWCCSTDEVESTYDGVEQACRFIHMKPRPDWRTFTRIRNTVAKNRCKNRWRVRSVFDKNQDNSASF
jgi:hypothetical protein